MRKHDRHKLGAENRPGKNARKVPKRSGDGFAVPELTVGRLVRQVYCFNRGQYETMRTGVHQNYHPSRESDKGVKPSPEAVELKAKPPVWPVLARKFLANRIDPEDYIQWYFWVYMIGDGRKGARFFLPRSTQPVQLLSADAVEAYRLAAEAMDAEIKCAYLSQLKTATVAVKLLQKFRGLDFVDSHAEVIGDLSIELSSLFRLCLSWQLLPRHKIFATLCKEFFGSSVIQFERNRESYLRHWGTMLPKSFVAQSRSVYMGIIGHTPDPVDDEEEGSEE